MSPSNPDIADAPTESDPESDLTTLLDEPVPKIWYRRPVLWIGSLLLVLLALGLWYWKDLKNKRAAPSYATEAVVKGDLTLTVTANGTVQPTRTISIGSELSGTVLKVNADVNDRLKKDQVLVELDPSKLNDQILRSRASLAAANAMVGQTAATVKETSAILKRFEEVSRLSGGKVPSRSELDTARAAHDRAVASDDSARAGVTDALAALSTDVINLKKASIRSPSNGVVLTRSVEPGNAVAASLQAVTLFTVAEDLAQLRLQVYVDEADVGSVNIGQSAYFTVSAYPSRKYPARITQVAYGSTITDNVVTYLTYLGVDNTDLSLRPGMTATATITATHRNDVLLVPNTALRFSPTAASDIKPDAKKNLVSSLTQRRPRHNTQKKSAASTSTASAREVWVLREGAPVSVAVMPGISDGHMTEIIGGELHVGMRVITDQKTGVKQ